MTGPCDEADLTSCPLPKAFVKDTPAWAARGLAFIIEHIWNARRPSQAVFSCEAFMKAPKGKIQAETQTAKKKLSMACAEKPFTKYDLLMRLL